MNNVFIFVAVRLKSSRLPEKALSDLAGKPLIIRLHERISQVTEAEGIVWCTSGNCQDDPLEVLARKEKINLYRGDELDVISRFIEAAWGKNAQIIVRVTGDNPLTDPIMMDHMIRQHIEEGAEYTYNEDLPRGTRSEVISLSALERCHELVEDANSSEYMTLMLKRPDHFKVLKVDALEKILRRSEMRLTVDTKEDLAVMSAIYEHYNGHPPVLSKVIDWLDNNPEILESNSCVKPKLIDETINVRLYGD